MITVTYELLLDAAYEARIEDPDDAIRCDYSGRAMYGDKCIGLVHNGTGELLRFVIAIFRADENAGDWLDEARNDSMGRSEITYWPGVQCVDAPDHEQSYA